MREMPCCDSDRMCAMVYSVRNPQSHHHCNEIGRDKMKRRKERRLEETLKREQERERSLN